VIRVRVAALLEGLPLQTLPEDARAARGQRADATPQLHR
jgi:hypothetical protein